MRASVGFLSIGRRKGFVLDSNMMMMVAVEIYESGPPGGLSSPEKARFVHEEGGLYGPGASGAGDSGTEPGTGGVSTDDVIQYLQYNADRGDASSQVRLLKITYGNSIVLDSCIISDQVRLRKTLIVPFDTFVQPRVNSRPRLPASRLSQLRFSIWHRPLRTLAKCTGEVNPWMKTPRRL
jgi:hypothetical protein